MPVAKALADFQASVAQCQSLIANAHRLDAAGANILPEIDRQQTTVAGFLNMFVAWETFLETVLAHLMSGASTTRGNTPTKFASPPNPDAAKKMVIGTMRYFDYGNHTNFKKIAEIYFDLGVPFKPPLDAVHASLDDLRAMRNSAAHISSTTQHAPEALALRLLATPSAGITLYALLTAVNPAAPAGDTIFETYKDVLLATAAAIAAG